VLVVLSEPPLSEGGAAGRVSIGLLRGLAAHAVDVTVVAARQPWAQPGDPPSDLVVEVVDVDRRTGFLQRQLERTTRPLGELSRGAFGARVLELARDADVLHLEETVTSWCGTGSGVPSLTHVHYLARRDRDPGPVWSPGFREVVEADAAERWALRRSGLVIASSPVIASELRRRSRSAEVAHVPLALDPSGYCRAPLDGPPVAGLIGTAAWPPTRNALERLLGSVWPAVRAAVPEARLVLAGRGLNRVVTGPLPAGVELVGEVPSAQAFLARLSLLLYPVARGSGTKVKVLEALASGLPVVTTTAGAEGVAPSAGVAVADTDAGLSAAAVQWLADPVARAAAGAAAHRDFAERFSPAAATATLPGLYARLASSSR